MWVLSNNGGDRPLYLREEGNSETHDDKWRKIGGLHLKNQNIRILEDGIKAEL